MPGTRKNFSHISFHGIALDNKLIICDLQKTEKDIK